MANVITIQKQGRLLAGYRHGVAHYVTVDLNPDQDICRQCEGTGQWTYTAAQNGFERIESCTCENCDGEGVIYSETSEDE